MAFQLSPHFGVEEIKGLLERAGGLQSFSSISESLVTDSSGAQRLIDWQREAHSLADFGDVNVEPFNPNAQSSAMVAALYSSKGSILCLDFFFFFFWIFKDPICI
jgi:hypothetical protein